MILTHWVGSTANTVRICQLYSTISSTIPSKLPTRHLKASQARLPDLLGSALYPLSSWQPTSIYSNHESDHMSYCHCTCLAIISKWLSVAQNPWNVHKVSTNSSSLCSLPTSLPSQRPLFSPCSDPAHCSVPLLSSTGPLHRGAHNLGCVPWLSISAQGLFLLR